MSYREFYLQARDIAEKIRSGEYQQQRKEKQTTHGILRRPDVKKPKVEIETEPDNFSNTLMQTMLAFQEPALPTEEKPVVRGRGGVKVQGTTEVTPKPQKYTLTTEGREYGARLVQDLQEIFGLSKAQAAGFVGNLDHETGGFRFLQEIEPIVPGSRGGFGFAQWTGPRRTNFENWASTNNMDISSYDANLGFLVHEIQNTSEGRFMEDLMNAKTVEEATRVVSDGFLRPGIPHMDSRIARATRYFSEVS